MENQRLVLLSTIIQYCIYEATGFQFDPAILTRNVVLQASGYALGAYLASPSTSTPTSLFAPTALTAAFYETLNQCPTPEQHIYFTALATAVFSAGGMISIAGPADLNQGFGALLVLLSNYLNNSSFVFLSKELGLSLSILFILIICLIGLYVGSISYFFINVLKYVWANFDMLIFNCKQKRKINKIVKAASVFIYV